MTQQITAGTDPEQGERRGRGPNRPFPALKFEDTLSLPKSILEHGIDGEIQKLTLFGKLNRSPDSGPSRTLLSSSLRYGLTTGSHGASSLSVTDDGRTALSDHQSPRIAAEKRFQLAIAKVSCFNSLYEKLKNHRLPDYSVLGDELEQLGVSKNDRQKAAEIFTDNLRFLGLITEIAGNEHVRPIEEVLDEAGESTSQDVANSNGTNAQSDNIPDTASATVRSGTNNPALHLDIQVHIDASASPDQIEQIFASMARHLYGRE